MFTEFYSQLGFHETDFQCGLNTITELSINLVLKFWQSKLTSSLLTPEHCVAFFLQIKDIDCTEMIQVDLLGTFKYGKNSQLRLDTCPFHEGSHGHVSSVCARPQQHQQVGAGAPKSVAGLSLL